MLQDGSDLLSRAGIPQARRVVITPGKDAALVAVKNAPVRTPMLGVVGARNYCRNVRAKTEPRADGRGRQEQPTPSNPHLVQQGEQGEIMSRVSGTVKWFNNSKGFGFIGRGDGPDVFVHFTAIQREGYKSLSEGDQAEFEIVRSAKGSQADKVIPKAA